MAEKPIGFQGFLRKYWCKSTSHKSGSYYL